MRQEISIIDQMHQVAIASIIAAVTLSLGMFVAAGLQTI